MTIAGVERRQVHTEFDADMLQRRNESLSIFLEGEQFVR